MRVDRTEYYLRMAMLASERSTCTRAKVGAVLTNHNRVVGTGYNGSPAGTPHCIDNLETSPKEKSVHKKYGCITDEEGRCATTIHAEVNSILSREGQYTITDQLVMYCTHQPCRHCLKIIAQYGIRLVYYITSYPCEIRDKLADRFGVKLISKEFIDIEK